MSHLKDNRRHNIITASNAWSAVYERQKLWREMTLRQAPFEGNEMTEYGNLNEPVALSEFEKTIFEICVPGNFLVVHKTLPFGASPDAYLCDYYGDLPYGYIPYCPVEIKCPYTQVVYPEIPERYYFQVQMQIHTCGTDFGAFVVWTPNELKYEFIKKNEAWLEWYTPLALEFMKYVEDDIEPKRWTKKPIFNKE